MARLTAPDGTVVTVADEKVDALVRHGYTPEETKAPAKRSRKSED